MKPLLHLLFILRVGMSITSLFIMGALPFTIIGALLGTTTGILIADYARILDITDNTTVQHTIVLASTLTGAIGTFIAILRIAKHTPNPLGHSIWDTFSPDHLTLMDHMALHQPIPPKAAVLQTFSIMAKPAIACFFIPMPVIALMTIATPYIPTTLPTILLPVFALLYLPLFLYSPHLQKLRTSLALLPALTGSLLVSTILDMPALTALTLGLVVIDALSIPLTKLMTLTVGTTHQEPANRLVPYMTWMARTNDLDQQDVSIYSYGLPILPGMAPPITLWNGEKANALRQPHAIAKWVWAQDPTMDFEVTYNPPKEPTSAHEKMVLEHYINQLSDMIHEKQPYRDP